MLEFVKVDHEADPYSVANTIALNALVARAKSKGELLAHLKKRGVEDDVAQATVYRLQEKISFAYLLLYKIFSNLSTHKYLNRKTI